MDYELPPSGRTDSQNATPAPQQRPRSAGFDEIDSCWVILAILLFLVAFAMAFEQIDVDLHDHRFSTEYADGATANAVEYIAKKSGGSAAAWAVAGLVCCAIVQLRGIRRELVISREIRSQNHHIEGDNSNVKVQN